MKVFEALNRKEKQFTSDFQMLCEKYGRDFAINYYANKLNEEGEDASAANQQQQQNQNNQKMLQDFDKVIAVFQQFMAAYKGLADEQMNKMFTALGEFKKGLGTLNVQPQPQQPAQQQQQPSQQQQQAQPQQQLV